MENDKLVRLSDVQNTILGYGIGWGAAKVKGVLASIPAVDAVEVCRCRECKNWETDWEPSMFDPENPRYFCGEMDRYPAGDWFCSRGQRREDGDT